MKKLFFIVGLLSLLTFFSCQNEENVYYSCDEAEDAWVKENLSSIRKMETTEWFSISVSLTAMNNPGMWKPFCRKKTSLLQMSASGRKNTKYATYGNIRTSEVPRIRCSLIFLHTVSCC